MTKRHICEFPERCKKCKHALEQSNWRANHKDEANEYSKKYNKEYYVLHKDDIKIQTSEYYLNNKENQIIVRKKYRDNNKEKTSISHKVYWEKNKHILLPKNKLRYEENKNKYNQAHYLNWKKVKYNSDPTYRLHECIGANLRGTFKYSKNKKTNRTTYYVGCTILKLKEHLGKLFLPGMNWENYGTWHVDHIIPKNNFGTDEESLKKCWHYSNLRPFWGKDNIRKSTSLNYISDAEVEVLMSQF